MSVAIDTNYLGHANKYIFNHDIMNCTADGVVGNQLYSGRALGLTQSEDVIQLHPDLKPLLNDIKSHYQRIGLAHSNDIIWNIDLHQLSSDKTFIPSVFFYGPHEHQAIKDQKWLAVVDYINSKNNFMALARELKVPIPATQCFNNVNEIKGETIRFMHYPCYLKAAISVSGVGIYRCTNEGELINAITKFAPTVPVQIQEEVESTNFLNLQYEIVDDEVIQLTASEQILQGFVHQGNRVPASHEPWELVDPMAYWLRDQGMKGIFAFDVAVVNTEHGMRFPAIECNPRYNGASYPTLIAKKLNIDSWIALNFSTQHRSLADIDLTGIEFNPTTGHGVVMVNWGTVLAGKIMFLIAGTDEQQRMYGEALKTRL